jgi:DNA processing protein
VEGACRGWRAGPRERWAKVSSNSSFVADPTHDPLADWLRLCHAPGVGPIGARRLLAAFDSPGAALDAPFDTLVQIIGSKLAHAVKAGAPPSLVARALAWADQSGHAILTLAHTQYPRALLEIADPPPLLYVDGDPAMLNRPAIAIVGSRHATPAGRAHAESFARELAHAGLTIVSGLALGIDACAHRGGLAGAASTIGVVGTGIDITYPSRHRELFAALRERGAIVSEFPLGAPPLAPHFPRRNRVISGLARGCLVVEAALDSGSLITARVAADQGRDVFALPGSVHSPLAKGCHALIKDGAQLVESVDDILRVLAWPDLRATLRPPTTDAQSAAITPTSDHDATQRALLEALGYDPVHIDLLCGRLHLTPDIVSAMLCALEMTGTIAALPGGRYQRVV